MSRPVLAGGLTALLMLGCVVPAHAATVTTLLPLVPGSEWDHVTGLNDAGVVVGHSEGSRDAFRWAADGTVTNLGKLPGDFSGMANAVNNADVVVGSSSGENTGMVAVRWDAAGQISKLPAFSTEPYSTSASGINGDGVIAGYATERWSGLSTAVRWNTDGTITALRPLPGHVQSSAGDISSGGAVVGSSAKADTLDRQHATLWQADGTVVELPALPGGGNSTAFAINDAGTVAVGWSENSNHHQHAVKWTLDGAAPAVTDLGTLGGYNSSGRAVNDAGVIIGEATATPGGPYLAVRWQPQAGAVLLPGTATISKCVEARAINDSGSIGGGCRRFAARWDEN
ncbi:MAG: hypothetical protein QOF58_5114 [Pseudonocardiales bacterium]|jgi:probable HAF family extracellular repeat protein|nr:hypothetical protein [Pseudonocardiales bacterium]